MIFGIGSDIVQVARIQENLDRHGDAFAKRILGEKELIDFRASAKPANFLARRFAAKEAAAKAIGTGIAEGIYFRDITVGHDARGKPELVFTGNTRDFIEANGIRRAHLSITDERDYAVAFVIFEVD